MCGIAGILATSLIDPEPLARMVSALRHRGPDDSGVIAIGDPGGPVLLGATRLAILDLSDAGHQPMRDPETGNVLVLNGEIYNHREVREEIGSRAGAWHSSGDTETFLKAWNLWGAECLPRMRGMFAAAVWDQARGTLWLARDRLGIKPLYYFSAAGTFAFASEVRALFASALIPKRWSPQGLASFVRFGSVTEPRTLVENVRSLPAGHSMSVKNAVPSVATAYWSLETRPGASISLAPAEDVAHNVRVHLERSVREHLLADVPVGCFLSGGVDSSVVTALAARAAARPIQTFTIGFPNTGIDESSYAAEVANRFGAEHHPIVLSPDEVVRMVPEAVGAMDLPSADGVNTYIVARAAAASGIKAVLSGLGGDELFAGYRSFRILTRARRFAPFMRPLGESGSRALATLIGLRDGAAQRFTEVMQTEASFAERYESLRSLWSLLQCEQMGLGKPDGYGMAYTNADPATQVSLLELGGYMRSTLLRDGDAMSMANSLEVRFPFLDHQLVEYSLQSRASTLGVRRRPKEILLAATADLLPERVARRPKQGFTLPMDEWMRGPLRDFTASGLRSLASTGALPRVDFDRLHHAFETGSLPWARLWEFVVLGHWFHNAFQESN